MRRESVSGTNPKPLVHSVTVTQRPKPLVHSVTVTQRPKPLVHSVTVTQQPKPLVHSVTVTPQVPILSSGTGQGPAKDRLATYDVIS